MKSNMKKLFAVVGVAGAAIVASSLLIGNPNTELAAKAASADEDDLFGDGAGDSSIDATLTAASADDSLKSPEPKPAETTTLQSKTAKTPLKSAGKHAKIHKKVAKKTLKSAKVSKKQKHLAKPKKKLRKKPA